MTHPLFPTWWGTVRNPPPLRYARPILAAGVPLERLIREGRGIPLDHAVNAHTRARRMGKNDRALLALAVYGFARNRDGMLRALSGSSVPEGGALALGLLDQLAPERREEMELFPGVGEALARLQSFRNEWAEVLEASRERFLPDADVAAREALCALFSVPFFWLDLGPWRSVGEAASELAQGRFPQKPQLRVNPSRVSRARAIQILSGEGMVGRPTERSPWGIVMEERAAVSSSRVLMEGLAEIQDEGSQLVALACRDESAKKILDLCAGAGGKSLALSALYGRNAEVVAHDADAGRLSAAAPRIARAHAGNIRLVYDPREVQEAGPYDLVLVDAPCSSTGTIRRNPDVAWRWRENDIRAFSSAQGELLRLGRELTSPGGLLVYATCSLLDPENETLVREFLRDHPDCTPEALPPEIDGDSGEARLSLNLPRFDGDGFFIAKMRKGIRAGASA
jgi:16S rRNA (cytosine967-C5)-methyltransferase